MNQRTQPVEKIEDAIERRVATLEATLVCHNPTVDRVLEACRRIQMRWQQSTEEAQND